MAKATSRSTQTIERLLQERRQYEAWLARIDAAADATPEHVRTRVRADYAARLAAVTEELKTHAEGARQLMIQKREDLTGLAKKEKAAAERLAETELRHAVGEYDEAQWSQAHKDALAALVAVREERQAIEVDLAKLDELDRLVTGKPARAPAAAQTDKAVVDELTFLKSVTEDQRGAGAPPRASGAHFEPATPKTRTPPTGLPKVERPAEPEAEAPKTLKCPECGTMNQPTEWYCERCGAELAAL